MAETILQLTLIWVEPEKEPLKATVESAYPDNGFFVIELVVDLLAPGMESKTLLIPSARIETVELVEVDAHKLPKKTDTNTFREEPGKSPHFRGMGQGNGSK